MVWNDFAGKHYSILYYTVKIAFRPYAMHHHCMLELWRASTLYFAADFLPFPLPQWRNKFKKISVWTGLHAQVHLFLANTEELDCKKLSFKVLHSTQLFNIHGNAHTKKMQIPHIYQRAFFEAMDKCHALLFAFSSQNLPVWCYKKHRVCIFSICMYFHFEFLHTYPRFEMQVVAFRSYWRKGASTLHSHKKSIFTFHTWMHLKF